MEFVLKHEEFESLREEINKPYSICPSNEGSTLLIKELIDQVLSFHPGAKAIHLGADDVFNIGTCTVCRQSSKWSLFLNHVTTLAEHVKEKNLKVLVWDDMMRDWPVETLSQIQSLVQPVIWKYTQDVETELKQQTWSNYRESWKKVWVASSFKGATTETTALPPIKYHVDNHLSWVSVEKNKFPKYAIQGIILTGWSRFGHSLPLCELLPAAIPSLALSLEVARIGRYTDNTKRRVFLSLGLGDMPIETESEYLSYAQSSNGNFPGARVFALAARLEKAKKNKQFGDLDALASDFAVALDGILHPIHIEEYTKKVSSSRRQG